MLPGEGSSFARRTAKTSTQGGSSTSRPVSLYKVFVPGVSALVWGRRPAAAPRVSENLPLPASTIAKIFSMRRALALPETAS